MPDDLHELSALYALDVLDADERARFEEHLADCDRCTTDLAGLREAATALAFVDGPAPPAELRSRILASSTGRAVERRRAAHAPLGLSRRPRSRSPWQRPQLRSGSGSGLRRCITRSRRSAQRPACFAIRSPSYRSTRVHRASSWSRRRVMLCSTSRFRLLRGAKTYEAWVASPAVQPAGVFTGSLVKLSRRVPRGALVMVTLERTGGVNAPAQQPLLPRSCVTRDSLARAYVSFPATCTRSCPSALHVTKQRGRESCTQQPTAGGH